ncbi:hypothetical protein D3C72_1981790 [compost metagenome]
MASLLKALSFGIPGNTRVNMSQMKVAGRGKAMLAAMPNCSASCICSHCAIPGLCTSTTSCWKGSAKGSLAIKMLVSVFNTSN